MSVLANRVDHFIEENHRILDRLNAILSDHRIKIHATDDLTHLDPLRMPSSHKFIATKKVLKERIGYCFSVPRADCTLANFDVVPVIAEEVLSAISRAI